MHCIYTCLMTPDLCLLSGVHHVVLTPPIGQHHRDAVPGCPRSIGRAKHMLGRKLYGPPGLDINQVIHYPNGNVPVKVDL